MDIKNKKFTGKAEVIITRSNKHKFIDKKVLFIGDFYDYFHFGYRIKKFELV